MVTAADILAVAGHREGYWTLSFPMFGAEKRGSPVVSYLRISDKRITIRDEIYKPDYVVVLDPSLIEFEYVKSGLKRFMIVNYPDLKKAKEKIGIENVISLNATKIAMEVLGKPITNTAMVGAFAGFTKIIKLETLKDVVFEWFEKKGEEIAQKNVEVVERAYREVMKYEDKPGSSIKTS